MAKQKQRTSIWWGYVALAACDGGRGRRQPLGLEALFVGATGGDGAVHRSAHNGDGITRTQTPCVVGRDGEPDRV
jgi:hypothetical protein